MRDWFGSPLSFPFCLMCDVILHCNSEILTGGTFVTSILTGSTLTAYSTNYFLVVV